MECHINLDVSIIIIFYLGKSTCVCLVFVRICQMSSPFDMHFSEWPWKQTPRCSKKQTSHFLPAFKISFEIHLDAYRIVSSALSLGEFGLNETFWALKSCIHLRVYWGILCCEVTFIIKHFTADRGATWVPSDIGLGLLPYWGLLICSDPLLSWYPSNHAF